MRGGRARRPDPALLRHLKRALPVAKEAACLAGEIIRKKHGKFRQLHSKADASLVTEADRASERVILRTLKKYFPRDRFVGEETGASGMKGTSSLFRWHVDPLDGTTNFVHGFPIFCVSIGLELENSGSVLGVIYQPILDEMYTAVLGSGAYRNGKRLRVSKVEDPWSALLTTGFSYRRQEYFRDEMRSLERIVKNSHAVRRLGSAAMDLALVAAGQMDGFWERGLSSWDVAAGILLVTEAGGKVTRLDGSPYRFGDPDILATNGRLHEKMSAVLNA